MLNTPIAPWPAFSEEEVEATARILRSGRVNYWTGEECRHFEREFAAWTGTAHAVALANGTLALDVALAALGIGPGDEVVVTPRTFIASASSVVSAGAVPVFAEVDPDSGNISARTIEAVLTPATRAIICVHLAGWPCDMDPIMALADAHGLKVIEDCAQAHGSRYRGRPVGSIGHIGAWSFCQDKIMSTGGEGGMVTTGDAGLWKRMWAYKDHGKSWDAVYERAHPPGYRWLHESFGTNWRMLEIQGAIGRIQLRRMAEWTARRTAIAHRLAEVARRYPDTLHAPLPDAADTHAFYRFYTYVRLDGLGAGWTRDGFIEALRERDVPAFQGSCSEVYLERAFDGTGWRPDPPLPVARHLGETSIMFLTHPTITDGELNRIADALAAVAEQAGRAATR